MVDASKAVHETTRRAFSVSVYGRHEGRVLLVFHKRMQVWLPIGGEIEAGETPLEAAQRELDEETAIVPCGWPARPDSMPGTPLGLLAYEEHEAGSKGLHMNFAFVADLPSRDVRLCDEHAAIDWVAATDVRLDFTVVPRNVAILVRKALQT